MKTEKGKATRQHYEQSEAGKVIRQHYEQSKAGKTVARRYRKSEKGKASYLRSKIKQTQHKATIIGYLQSVFKNIKIRCDNPKWVAYKNYGGRGIKCLFENSDKFVNYVVNELQIDPRGLDIDRIDNDGNYEPGNIRFISHKENCSNRR